MLDYAALIDTAFASLGQGVTSNAVWDWIRSKLDRPFDLHVVSQIEAEPDDEDHRHLMLAHLAHLLKKHPELAAEFAELLAAQGPDGPDQTLSQPGDGNSVNTG